MTRTSKIASVLAILVCVLLARASAAPSETRLALVIGNASYKVQPLVTAVNDAALISQTLQLAGFDVTGARDLDQGLLRDAIRNFTSKVANAGAGAVVFVYFAGYAVQLAGDNYLIPVGAEISDVGDLPARSLSLSELKHALSALNARSTFIVLDAGRPGPFVLSGQAGGLAWTEPEPDMLIAFSTAPGTLARDAAGSYGAYAKALAEMIGEGGLTPANLFDQVRLRVHEATAGGQVPWHASRIETPFKFRERATGTLERNDTAGRTAQFRSQPMRALGAQNAYMTALLRDTFDAYSDFLADYWQDPMTKRVRALLAARRESITWERACQANEPNAFWSYLERYPNGPHVADARRLLTAMGATTSLPAKFARIEYEVPPPLPDELEYLERPTLMLADPSFGFEPPPPTSTNFLEPSHREFLDLKAPAPSQGHALPVLNLPLLVSTRAPSDTRAPSNPSNDRNETWVMKPAIDVPDGPQKRAVSSLAPVPAKSPPSLAKEDSQPNVDATQSNTQGAQSGNQALAKVVSNHPDQKDGTSAMQSTSRAAPVMPAWLTDVAQTARVSLRPSTVGNDMPQSGPSMFASASAGLTFQTWHYGLPQGPRSVRVSLPPAHSTSLPPAPARSPAQPSAISIVPPHATGGILRPVPRSTALAPAGGGSPSKPRLIIAQPEPTSTAGAPVKPRKKPSPVKPAPQSQLVRDAHEPPEAAPSDQ